ncbi:AEC family transporter [Rubellimicrobium rubrum]|uniref:AEC family transporter n=1 Tax=Rubellimicrobium rubrum TaxID=2585369 RepID=A0A5C4MVC7_9RHOB|nr:AEC family transporter [Rubellimicrobium rubrum]TNC48456.1 AEC family transporter [Rubellimicrobium rubrum]
MLSTLSVVLPIFALILAGWLARRLGALGAAATTELSRFVVSLALPALLFDIMAHARWADLWQPGFVAAFGLGSGVVFGLTLMLRLRQSRPLTDAVLDGLNAGYANTGFLGFPLAMVALGRDALGPTLIATILTVCVLFAVAIVMIEISLQPESRPVRLVAKVGRSLLRNPLLVAPVLGSLVPLAGLSLPGPAESFLRLLGGAASPCALVALGLFLADAQSAGLKRDTRSTALLVAFKLLLQPAVTWTLAVGVFGLSPAMTQTAVLLAALPTGTGPFMLAELYRRDATTTSGVVLASTLGSVLTITAYLAWIG